MSGKFGLTWTPTMAGDYKITAAFGGSDSYGSSFDSTYATVTAAHATETPAPTASLSGVATATDLMTFIVIAIVAIIIAISDRNSTHPKKTLRKPKTTTFPFFIFLF